MSDRQYSLKVVSRKNELIAELEGAQLQSVTWELNGPGSINYTMPQNDRDILAPVMHSNEVQLWLPGGTKPAQWAFHEDESQTPNSVAFTCPGLLGYMNGRYVTNTSFYYGYDENHNPIGSGVEQFDIIADVWRQKAYDLNIGVAPYVPSGVNRYRFYDIFDHQNILSDILAAFPLLMDSLGNYTGFDFDVVWDAAGNRNLALYYPGRGAVLPDVQLEYGRNITDYTVAVKGSSQSNTTYFTGGSNGAVHFENYALSTSDELASYGHWESVQSASEENDVNTLQQLAVRWNSTHKYPVSMPEITAVETNDKLLGIVNPGDSISVKINRGRTSLFGTYRVQSVTWAPQPGNLKFTLFDPTEQPVVAVPGSFRALNPAITWATLGPSATATWNDLEVS